MIRTALFTALFATAIAATPAAAYGPPASQAVSHADLDLKRPADVARLRHRIAGALENVCGSYATSESWQEREIARCRTRALAQADAQIARLMVRTVQVAAAGQ